VKTEGGVAAMHMTSRRERWWGVVTGKILTDIIILYGNRYNNRY